MFEQSLVSNAKTRTGFAFFCSTALQSLVVGLCALTSLVFSSPLAGLQSMSRAMAVWSPPPAQRATVVKASHPTPRRMFDETRLTVPVTIPRGVALIEDDPGPIAAEPGAGVDGLYGGTGSGPMPEIIARPPEPSPPAPPAERVVPPPAPPQPVVVGGRVQQSKLVHSPTPQYPPLARQQRISGTVKLHAVIGRDGSIERLRAISGHPLLIPAALEAVAKWRYSPTLLNGEPVEVITEIEVRFTLNP